MKQNYVIVRGDRSGVFFGELEKENGQEVLLKNVRKIWRWDGACAIEQLAVDGVLESKKINCQFTVIVDSIIVKDVIQLIPCTDKSIESLKSVHVWKQ
jgi:hypothetical protein